MWISARPCWSISAAQVSLCTNWSAVSLWLAALSSIWLLSFSSGCSVWCCSVQGNLGIAVAWNFSLSSFLTSWFQFQFSLSLTLWWLIWIVSAGSTAWLAFWGCSLEDAEFGRRATSLEQMLNSFKCTWDSVSKHFRVTWFYCTIISLH